MNSVCLFASYFEGDHIPYYNEVYLKELKKHFTKLVFLCSKTGLTSADTNFLKKEGIEFVLEKNEGYDFGLWHKALQSLDLHSYDRLALVNDSAVLFAPLNDFMEWAEKNPAPVLGMTRSEAIAPHLQSYFILYKKPVLTSVNEYFTQTGIRNSLSEVIQRYEIGLSQFLQEKHFEIEAFVDNKNYSGEFSPYYYLVNYHISKKLPLIKKKILLSTYRKDELFNLARMNFKLGPEVYVNRIKQHNSKLILDFDTFYLDAKPQMNLMGQVKYNTLRLGIQFLRLFDFRKKVS